MSVIAQLGTLSYGVAAAAYAVLVLLLAISWRHRLTGALLTAAAFVNGLWAASVAVAAYEGAIGLPVSGTLELLRNGFWLAFFAILLTANVRRSDALVQRYRLATLRIFWAGAVVLFVGLALEWTHFGASFELAATSYYGVRVLLAIVGLMLIEKLYRGVPGDNRWGVKFLCLGVGALFAYDLALYAEAMLFRQLDREMWAGRGIANALVVPLIAVSAARNPQWSLDIAVSRRIVFQSTALFGAGAYLLAVAAAGYYIRLFGGSWGGILQTLVLFAGIVGFLLLAFSGTLRAQMKVFVNKNFFSYRYDYRDEWLRLTRDLAGGERAENFGGRAVRAIANLVESPGGGLWLRQENEVYEPVAHWNASTLTGSEPSDGALAQFLGDREWVVNLDEYRKTPALYKGLEIPRWLLDHDTAWLVVPLISHDGLLGFAVLLRSRVRLAIDWEVNDLLKTAGRQVAVSLAQLRASQALLVARQFESFHRMSAFVVHDLKNLVAQLSLLVANAARHRNNPEFQQDMLETVYNASEKMKRLLTQLRDGATPVEPPTSVDLHQAVLSTIASKAPLAPTPSVEILVPGVRALAHRERLDRVVGHLLQNACEATTSDGTIRIRIGADAESAIIEVIDSGIGMSAEFIRDHLFRPFESTKRNGMGIGIYESREYVRELGGQLDVTSAERKGTCFRISLPLVRSIAPDNNNGESS